jgi:hypothetical protein
MQRRDFVSLLGTAACATFGAPGLVQAADAPTIVLVLVMSKELQVRDISFGLARRAFLGDPTELGGRRIVPFNYPVGDPLRQAFDKLLLGMGPDEMGRYWVDRRIRGQGMPPKTAPSRDLMRAIVGRVPGVLGYLTADFLDGSVQPLSIDGKRHTDAGYPLLR